ncbi:MAG: tyrosine-type recombinase/integrase [Flavobacteriales bacterium]
MKGLHKKITNEYVEEYVNRPRIELVNYFSKPKLYIPTKRKNGKEVPTIEKGKRWYVFYYFRNPATGKMGNRPFKIYRKLNSLTSIKERKKVGKMMCDIMYDMLKGGYSPYDEDSKNVESTKEEDSTENVMTVRLAFEHCLEHKKGSLKLGSYNTYKTYVSLFMDWCKDMELDGLDILELEQSHIIDYLNYLRRDPPRGRGLKPTSVANTKRHLGAIMAKLYEDKMVPKNFFPDIKTKKGKPEKNQPFTKAEVKIIRDHCLEHEPVLYDFLRFIFYSFLRNQEIVRIQVKHIDMEKRLISIPTKTDTLSHILMIEPMYQFLLSKKLHKCKKSDLLFTPSGKPGAWKSSEKGRVAYFSKRFLIIKEQFGFEPNKTTYSFRHNAAVDLFQSFVENGQSENEAIGNLMMITRHRTEDALRNYLRDVGAIVPKDWSDSYNIEF